MNPDTDITLNIGANTEGVESALSRLQQEVQQAFSSSNAKVRAYGIQLDKITERIEKQAEAMRRLASTPVTSDAYKEASQNVIELEKHLEELRRVLVAVAEGGAGHTPEFEAMKENYREVLAEYRAARAEFEKMQTDPNHYKMGYQTEEYAKMNRELQRLGVQAGIVRQRMGEASANANKFTQYARKGSETLKTLARNIKDRVTKNLREGKKETQKFGNEAEFSFKKALKFVIRYGIGMASLFRLYRRLRQLTKEAMQTMGKAIPEVGQQLVDLSNHVTQLKNSLATIAQPLLNYFMPVIQQVISALVTAMNALANFFAMLTGQKYIYKAAKGNKTLADSISGAGKAAKEAKEEIAEYDKLIVLDQPNDGGGGGGGGSAADDVTGAFEKVAGYSNHFIEDIQKIWSVFKQAWEEKGEAVINAFKYAWKNAVSFITTVWHTFVKVFTNGAGLAWVKSILEIFEKIGIAVGDIAKAMENAWTKDNKGYKLIEEILGMFTSMNLLVSDIIKSIGDALGSEIGESVFGQILTMATNIAGIVKAFIDNFREAWNKDGTGTNIFKAALELVDTILGHLNDMLAATKEWARELNLEKVLTSVKQFLTDIKPSIDTISETISKLYTEIVLPLLGAIIEYGIPAVLETIKGWLDEIASACSLITTELEVLKPLIDMLNQDVGTGEGTWLQMIKEFFTWLGGDPLKGTGFGKVLGFLQKIKDIIDLVEFGVNYQDTRSASELEGEENKSFIDKAKEIGEAIILGIKLGMEEQIKNNPFYRFVEKWIIKPIRKALKIESPSKVMKEIGKDIIRGLLNGVNAEWPEFFEDWNKKCESIVEKAKGIVEKGQEFLGTAWSTVKQKLGPVAPYIQNQFRIAYGGVTGTFGAMGSFFSNQSGLVQKAFSGLDGALGGVFSATYQAMTAPFSNTEKDFDTIGSQVKSGLAYGANSNTILSESAGGLYKSTYANMLGAFATTETDFNKIGKQVKSGLAYGADSSTILSESAGKLYEKTYGNMKGAFKDAQKDFNDIGNYVSEGFSKGAKGAQTAMENLAGYVQGDFKKNMNSGFETSFNTFGSSVADSFESSIRTLIDAFNKSIRTMADKLNSTIAKLNSSLSLGAGASAGTSGKSKGGSAIPQLNVNSVLIPKFLAQGAVLPPNKEFLAVLGDQHTGTNIETPLDTMIAAFKTALNEEGSSNRQPIVLQLNGKEVAQVVWDEETKRYKQTGSWNPRLA